MTPKELVLNFVYQNRKPFEVVTIANMTDLEPGIIEPIIQELLEEKTIKLICSTEPIYARSNRYNPVVGYNQKGDWRFDPLSAASLLDIIEKDHYVSVRDVAADFGLSRQWVHVYMEALASIGIIGYGDNGYYIITKENLSSIGTCIKPGILKEMRTKAIAAKNERKKQERLAWQKRKQDAKIAARKRFEEYLRANEIIPKSK